MPGNIFKKNRPGGFVPISSGGFFLLVPNARVFSSRPSPGGFWLWFCSRRFLAGWEEQLGWEFGRCACAHLAEATRAQSQGRSARGAGSDRIWMCFPRVGSRGGEGVRECGCGVWGAMQKGWLRYMTLALLSNFVGLWGRSMAC